MNGITFLIVIALILPCLPFMIIWSHLSQQTKLLNSIDNRFVALIKEVTNLYQGSDNQKRV